MFDFDVIADLSHPKALDGTPKRVPETRVV